MHLHHWDADQEIAISNGVDHEIIRAFSGAADPTPRSGHLDTPLSAGGVAHGVTEIPCNRNAWRGSSLPVPVAFRPDCPKSRELPGAPIEHARIDAHAILSDGVVRCLVLRLR